MSKAHSDVAMIDQALDSAHVLDDYVRSVIAIGAGQVGGDQHDGNASKPQAWARRVLFKTGRGYGREHVVQGMAALFAPEQLRKAAIEAVQLSLHIEALESAGSDHARRAALDCIELGVVDYAATLSNREITSKSPELKDLHRRLGRVINALNQARTRALLEAMRSSSGPDPSAEPPR